MLEAASATLEKTLQDNTDIKRVRQIEKEFSQLEYRKSRLTYLVIDGTITKEDYDTKRAAAWVISIFEEIFFNV